ncbi:L-serine ammonia-lyase, iron-sulfur-dependent, subunit alpha [Clostridium sp. AM58-1XD]|uniref:L-serine ammonia-lyase, iron-sulfur-dependent, subunit beta n=1 Tax=Clostridium sp. AM58-1XD TaxID=2292307 RepID=UPI000E4A699B|nr:L-serine ammonia-lyase, iron-sulfur-dependent, subunit alpha [Clostridium sp. AM58-1XD]RGZ00459.1 L-serine ammonia-lyase, iron-sulfur-dependent, subunit alpha [Clostridium sp. AM58-1XD]
MTDPPFTTAAEAATFAGGKEALTMADLAIEYETGLCMGTRAALRERMNLVLSVMRRSMVPPPENWPVRTFIIPQLARFLKVQEDLQESENTTPTFHSLNLGLLNGAMSSATAVMENSCVHRTIVAAPTAGSCGVIPAAVINLGDRLGCNDKIILNGLWASGLVGAFIANQATFGAEVAGCQAEIGSAAAMAAAGVVELRGGSVLQGFHTAAIAMQSFMGLICDPVAGLTEFPCIERNVTGASVAVTSANMALCGMTSPVSLDETIRTMLEVGKLLPKELRCTCEGGLCTTETGRILAQVLAKELSRY